MKKEHQNWTEVIESKTSLFSINFKEIWYFRDLLFMLVKRDFVTYYKQTILGPIWFFIQPLLTLSIYVVLFGQIAKLSTDGTPQIPFYLAGITVWSYFSESLTKVSTVFKDNTSVFGKVYFPRLIMPISIVVSGLMKFSIQFGFFIIVVLYYTFSKGTIQPNLWVLATPFLILLMAFFSIGLGTIFSSMTTKYKDLVFLLTFGIQLFMYATPVIYSVSSVPETYKWIINYNPLTPIFECFRYGYLGSGNFEPLSLLVSTFMIGFILFAGVVVFNKVEKNFIDTV